VRSEAELGVGGVGNGIPVVSQQTPDNVVGPTGADLEATRAQRQDLALEMGRLRTSVLQGRWRIEKLEARLASERWRRSTSASASSSTTPAWGRCRRWV
jgi:hypothetical protein